MSAKSFTSGIGLTRKPGHVFADELVVGSRIIPPGKKRPVEVFSQLGENRPGKFEFVCRSPQGMSALVLNRFDQVEVAA